ncbi:LRR domain containing protein [Trema orientale]|uniref:LRR domain containing protein n=1 Tax=Trema orientale TaxID=63057 RepID=A0A2P5F937_TREOI|nr:LRR domain containing protein [Trema orientale]
MSTSLFPWHFIFSILLGISIPVVSGRCLGHQQALLLQMRRNLEFDDQMSTKLAKWNVRSPDCCFWEGVSCEDGRVVELDLSNEGISGELDNSSSLFSLHHLRSLDLSCNFFSSMIPSKIGNLTNLNYLNLSNSGFLGQIPREVSQLRNLVTLDLSTTNDYESTILLAANELKLENPTMKVLGSEPLSA